MFVEKKVEVEVVWVVEVEKDVVFEEGGVERERVGGGV